MPHRSRCYIDTSSSVNFKPYICINSDRWIRLARARCSPQLGIPRPLRCTACMCPEPGRLKKRWPKMSRSYASGGAMCTVVVVVSVGKKRGKGVIKMGFVCWLTQYIGREAVLSSGVVVSEVYQKKRNIGSLFHLTKLPPNMLARARPTTPRGACCALGAISLKNKNKCSA